MRVARTKHAFCLAISDIRRETHENSSLGFVPTMGALHAGHVALMDRARRECDWVVVSIYVNPTQFGPREDLSRYPRPREQDLQTCQEAGVDLVFAPKELYEEDASTWVTEEVMSQGRCSISRPQHFRGVATVVVKLLNLVDPDRAYFGEKDFQQLEVVRRVVRDLDMPVKIVGVPTVRDADGVALSSRNAFLSAEDRSKAVRFAALLREAAVSGRTVGWLKSELSKEPGIELDYVEAVRGRLCAAVRVGRTRLIDNQPISLRARARKDTS
jgi:pantoate--beta-alanine ligase